MFFDNIFSSPDEYSDAAFVFEKAGHVLFEKLNWMMMKPDVVLDVGCGIGLMAKKLQERYPDAKVIAIDSSEAMLKVAKKNIAALSCADTIKLPLKDESVDLLCANFLLPWHDDLQRVLAEWHRVLRPNGLLIFTALGPDTLKEQVKFFENRPHFIDMHDIGDSLLHAGFADPVLEVDYYTVLYKEKNKLIRELTASGMGHFTDHPLADNINLEVTYEVIFGHAFMPATPKKRKAESLTKIPINQLREQLRKR